MPPWPTLLLIFVSFNSSWRLFVTTVLISLRWSAAPDGRRRSWRGQDSSVKEKRRVCRTRAPPDSETENRWRVRKEKTTRVHCFELTMGDSIFVCILQLFFCRKLMRTRRQLRKSTMGATCPGLTDARIPRAQASPRPNTDDFFYNPINRSSVQDQTLLPGTRSSLRRSATSRRTMGHLLLRASRWRSQAEGHGRWEEHRSQLWTLTAAAPVRVLPGRSQRSRVDALYY